MGGLGAGLQLGPGYGCAGLMGMGMQQQQLMLQHMHQQQQQQQMQWQQMQQQVQHPLPQQPSSERQQSSQPSSAPMGPEEIRAHEKDELNDYAAAAAGLGYDGALRALTESCKAKNWPPIKMAKKVTALAAKYGIQADDGSSSTH